MAHVIKILADVINGDLGWTHDILVRANSATRYSEALSSRSLTAMGRLGIAIMSRIIVLTATRASELKERSLRARKIDRLSDAEALFLDELLHKLKGGAGTRISGKHLASLIEIEAKSQARSEER
jgi:hypothetical protein